MSKVVILNVAGESQIYVADLEAGTVVPVNGQPAGELAALLSLAESGAVVTRGVTAAIAVDPSTIPSSFHEG